MTGVTTIYDAFSGTLKFYINGRPLPNISQLSRFQQRPFYEWCAQLFSVIYEEINDDYTMTYVGRGCESRMLAYYSRRDEHCRCFTTKIPLIPDSALKRLKKLHMLCMNGLAYRKYTCELAVVTDLPAKDVEKLFKQSLPKLCYCNFKIHCDPLEQCGTQKQPFYILTSDSGEKRVQELLRDCRAEGHFIKQSEHTHFCGIEGRIYVDAVRQDDMDMVLQDIFEFRLFPEILQKTMKEIKMEDPSHPQYYNFFALNKVEPATVPVFPLSMEFGQEKEIELKTIPEGFSPEALNYRVSSEEILKIENNVMKAVGSGEVIVEAYVPGQSVCVAHAAIKVVRRNRVTHLQLAPERLELCVGDHAKVAYAYKPADADNVSSIRLYSVDGSIASIKQDGEVSARKPGTTKLLARTDNDVRDACQVTVYPKLENIKLSLQKTQIRCGEYCAVETERIPAQATLDPLIFSVEPSSVAEYDAGSRIIVTKKPGEAVLYVTDSRHSVTVKSAFTVKKKGLFR